MGEESTEEPSYPPRGWLARDLAAQKRAAKDCGAKRVNPARGAEKARVNPSDARDRSACPIVRLRASVAARAAALAASRGIPLLDALSLVHEAGFAALGVNPARSPTVPRAKRVNPPHVVAPAQTKRAVGIPPLPAVALAPLRRPFTEEQRSAIACHRCLRVGPKAWLPKRGMDLAECAGCGAFVDDAVHARKIEELRVAAHTDLAEAERAQAALTQPIDPTSSF